MMQFRYFNWQSITLLTICLDTALSCIQQYLIGINYLLMIIVSSLTMLLCFVHLCLNLKIRKQRYYQIVLMILVLVAYTEITLQEPMFLITLGHFQMIIMKEESLITKLVIYLYLSIRIYFLENSRESTYFYMLKYFLLGIHTFLIERFLLETGDSGCNALSQTDTMIPIQLLEDLDYPFAFAVFKNTSIQLQFSTSTFNEDSEIILDHQSQTDENNQLIEVRISNDLNNDLNMELNLESARRNSYQVKEIIEIVFQKFRAQSLKKTTSNFFGNRKSFVVECQAIKKDVYVVVKIKNIEHSKKGEIFKVEQDEINQKLKELREPIMKQVYKVTHDMKTPLNAIINLQNGLKDHIEQIHYHKYLKPSLSACKMLMGLLTDILDVAQLEQSKLKLVYRPFNLEKLIRKTLEIFELQMEKKFIYINLELDDKIPQKIMTDKNRLKQILINLLSNAMKYTKKNGNIYVKLTQIVDKQINVEVRDTGIGIKPENMEKLFSDFGKINDKENVNFNPQGVGLGLQISNELAIMMGSPFGIKVRSVYGVGTSFSFEIIDQQQNESENIDYSMGELYDVMVNVENTKTFQKHALPPHNKQVERSQNMAQLQQQYLGNQFFAVPQPQSPTVSISLQQQEYFEEIKLNHQFYTPNPKTNPLRIQKDLSSDFLINLPEPAKQKVPSTTELQIISLVTMWKSDSKQGSHILVVDDDTFNVMVLTMMLEQLNMKCESAYSGESAIELVKQRRRNDQYKLIFMDIQMLGIDGLEATKAILKVDNTIKVVACSGFDDANIKKQCMSVGMFDIMSKPVQKSDLRQMIRRLYHITKTSQIKKNQGQQ